MGKWILQDNDIFRIVCMNNLEIKEIILILKVIMVILKYGACLSALAHLCRKFV